MDGKKLVKEMQTELVKFYVEAPKIFAKNKPINKKKWNSALHRATKRMFFLFMNIDRSSK